MAFNSESGISVFGKNTDIPEVISLFLEPDILDEWVGIEKDAISIAIDDILSDSNAFGNRFEIVNDIDTVRTIHAGVHLFSVDGSQLC